MFTFILIVNSSEKPECAGDYLKRLGSVRQESGGRYLVEKNGMKNDWIAISLANGVAEDFDNDEISKIKERISDPSYFLIEGRNAASNLANNFLLNIDDDLNAMIDNDHGCIENVNYFKKLSLAGVDWLHHSPGYDKPAR